MAWGAVAAVAIPMIIDYVKGQQSGKQKMSGYDEAGGINQAALDELANIPIPVLEKLLLEDPQLVEELTPKIAGLQYQSEMQNITTDPRFAQAQIDALSKLGELSDGGMNEADKNALLQLQAQQAQANRGQQEAIQQNMAERGMAGGGQEMAAKLQAQQSLADRGAMLGSQINADASQRALEAMMNAGELGGQMQQNQFSQRSDIAQAQDAAKRFNSGLMSTALQRDTGERQRLAEGVVANRNLEEQYRLGIPQKDFDNKMKKFSEGMPIVTNQGQLAVDRAAEQGRQTAAEGDLISTGVGAGIDIFNKWEPSKKPKPGYDASGSGYGGSGNVA